MSLRPLRPLRSLRPPRSLRSNELKKLFFFFIIIIQTKYILNFLRSKRQFQSMRLVRSLWLLRLIWSLGASKLVVTLQYSTLMINSSLYSCLERNQKVSRIMKLHCEFLTFSVRGCRGHSMGAKSIPKVLSKISTSQLFWKTIEPN